MAREFGEASGCPCASSGEGVIPLNQRHQLVPAANSGIFNEFDGRSIDPTVKSEAVVSTPALLAPGDGAFITLDGREVAPTIPIKSYIEPGQEVAEAGSSAPPTNLQSFQLA